MSKSLKKYLLLVLVFVLAVTVVACGKKDDGGVVQDIINQAQKMDRNELYAKAIEELDGKTMNAVGNSSRGRTAQEYFLAYLRGEEFDATQDKYVASTKVRAEFPQYKADFNGKINWTQPKNNAIFAQISSDVKGANHTLAMTLIQDGNQIQSKMLDTGYLLNYIPKEWGGDEATNGHPFALQSLNKVFMYNSVSGKEFKNVWQFVAEGNATMFMGVDSEPVGKNFLYMLTQEHYSNLMKDAFDALPASEKAYFEPVIAGLESEAKSLGFNHASAKYSFAWIKLWMESYNQQTDDGPIANDLTQKSAVGQSALIVYSKLRSIQETENTSKNNIKVAAYQDDYVGIGGYMYKHYLQVLKTSPFPWTSVAFIHFMTTTTDGFSPWGKDIGGYSSDISVTPDHSKDGYEGTVVKFPSLNDRGYDWWTNQTTGGKLVIEDPAYVSSVSATMGDWIDILERP